MLSMLDIFCNTNIREHSPIFRGHTGHEEKLAFNRYLCSFAYRCIF